MDNKQNIVGKVMLDNRKFNQVKENYTMYRPKTLAEKLNLTAVPEVYKGNVVSPDIDDNSQDKDKKSKIIVSPDIDDTSSESHSLKQQKESSNKDSTCSSMCGLSEDGVANICGTDKKLYPIMDPRLNLKEITKNLLLLEDHLFHEGMRCQDCLGKHLVLSSAYATEAISLDKDRKYSEDINNAIKNINNIHKQIIEAQKKGNLTDEDCNRIAQEIRKIRKPLCQKYGSFLYE